MERIPQGIYTPEVRAEAVRLVETAQISVAAAAKRLLIPKNSLLKWVGASRAGKLGDITKDRRVPTEA